MSVSILKKILPDEYQEIEYIESTGSQWINTNVNAQNGYKIKCSASFANGANKNISGIQTGSGNNYYRAFGAWASAQTGTKFSLGIGVGGAVNTDKIYNINQKYELEANLSATNPYLKIDGENATFTESPGGVLSNRLPNGNIYLFALNNNGSVATGFIGKLYGNIEIYVEDIVVRNFIPCYRKSDNIIGLYDLINNVFYTNQGTGTFSKGSNIYQMQKVKPNIVVYNTPRIPSTYQEVEYIESTGTQYIDTGVIPDSNTDIEFTYSYTTTTLSSTETRVFGSRGSGNSQALFIGLHSSYNYCWYINYGDTSNTLQGIIWGTIDTNKHTVRNTDGIFYFDDVNVINFSVSAFTSPYSALIFGSNADGTIRTTKARVYSCKMFKQGNLVRDFVPCYRKLDGVGGLYDVVNGVFYTNQGSGSFVKGASIDLPSEYQKLQYIQTTGTQYIDTGTYPHQIGKWELDIQYTDESPANQTNGCFPTSNQRFDIGTTSASKWTLNMGALNTYTDSNNERHLFVLDKINNKVSIDATEYSVTAATFTSQTTYSVLIGARNYYGSSSKYNCNEKIYSSKIYDTNGVLIRNFVPCYNKSSGTIGLYDLVNSAFYQNAGTGTFLKSGDVLPMKKVKIRIFKNIVPTEYQRVEYLGISSDNPYIDTGITGDQKTKAEVTFSSSGDTQVCLFGYQANAVGITFNLSISTNNTRFGSWTKVGWGSDMFDGQKHIVEISQQGLYQDGVLVDTPTAQIFTTGNLTLFKADGAVTYGNKTIYGCRIWNNGVLQRDLVPCYRKNDNVNGMYDFVSKQFFANVGTGAFTKGNNVNNCDIIKI